MPYLYLVRHQLLSVISAEGLKGFLRIPTGTVVAVTQRPPEDSPFVEVLWGRNRSLVFVQDLLDRADLIEKANDGQIDTQSPSNVLLSL
jgi:hypothetical protein